jgi:DNA (cytosine-5)-methyltransferase 1
MRQLDLFAGIGGISLAAEWAGIETVAFCEKEPFAQEVIRRRFPGRPIYNDIFNLTREVLERDGITGMDIVSGGFPCQPFSHAGKRGGTADDRYLWPQMCRVIGELRPTWVLAENVDGLVSMAQSDWDFVMEDETTICEEAEMVIETIRKDLEAIRYLSIPVIVPACGVGASHRRYRIFILGYTECSERSGQPGWCAGDLADRHGELEEGTVDNSTSQGLQEQRRPKRFESYKEKGAGVEPGPERCSEILANPCSTGCEERDSATISRKQGYGAWGGYAFGPNGSAQPGVGGSPYELSDWLDGFGLNPLDALINFISSYPQPALIGQTQSEWEPSRIAMGVKNRTSRLRALGNAVDPLQVLPIFYGIERLNRHIKKELLKVPTLNC